MINIYEVIVNGEEDKKYFVISSIIEKVFRFCKKDSLVSKLEIRNISKKCFIDEEALIEYIKNSYKPEFIFDTFKGIKK